MTEEEKKKTSEKREEQQPQEEEKTEEQPQEKAQEDEGNDEEEQPEEEAKPEKPKKRHLEIGKTKFSISLMFIAVAFFAAGFLVNAPAAISTGTADAASLTGQVTAQEAAATAVDYINDYLLQPGVEAELINYTEANGVYEFNMGFTSDQGSMVYVSYVTKDGKLLFTNTVDMGETPDIPDETPQTPLPQDTGAPKSDKPKVDVFIMSYCPYGLQMQKAALPAMELLAGKADINIRFVYYIMHEKMEIDENTRQYCIQKEQNDKLIDYLECFTLTDDTYTCRATAGIDETMLSSCMTAADTEFSITANYEDTASWLSGNFPLYDVDKALNEQYGVGGSPTVVINGQQAQVDRSPEAFKQAVCGAFNTPPEECSTTLSTASSSPGIGGGTGASTGGAACAT
ncbi:MAG: hypothetical protein V3V26_00405 [Candidatus Aenigmarchaeota archaeon]